MRNEKQALDAIIGYSEKNGLECRAEFEKLETITIHVVHLNGKVECRHCKAMTDVEILVESDAGQELRCAYCFAHQLLELYYR